ncbi:MAG: transporter substrate-binding domain-containing protein [Lachnospiraceae bacterium]|nr:transporter substrate-binding domain-containing protein [Lachnospiraceae bacterium]
MMVGGLLAGMVLPLLQPICAQAEESTGKTIKVGFFEFAGYHDVDAYGNKGGYGYDFIQMMARYDDNNYEFVGYDRGWNEMLTMLENGEIDLLTNVARTPEREEKYLYSQKTIGNDGSVFTVRDDNSTVISGNYATYNGLTVGSIEDSVQVDEFEEFAEEKGFTYTMKTYATEEAMVQGLINKEVDGIVSIGLRNLQNEKVIEQINSSDMYVIVRNEDTELMAEVNRAIDRLDQESSNWRSELFDKYYQADQGDNISFLTDELEYIDDLKAQDYVLKVAVNPDRKSYSYYENGEIKGIIPRVFDEVARRIGLKYEIQVVKTRQEYQDLLAAGEIDACLDVIYDVSAASDNGYELTAPFLSASLARIVRSDFDGTVKKVAILNQADLKDSHRDQIFSSVETVLYDTTSESIEAVEKGDVDASYVYSYAAQIALNEDPQNDIRMNILMDYGNEFAIGVPESKDYQLLTILNKGINSIEQEYIQNIIMDETDYMMEEVPLSAYLLQNTWILVVGVIILLLIVVAVVLLLARMNYLSKLKLEEEKKNKLLQEKAEQEAEFVQAMTYVCKTNELVRNTNLANRAYTDYYLEDGILKTKTEPYVGFDVANHNDIFYQEDYEQIVSRFDEKKVEYLSQHGGGAEYFECRAKNAAGEYRWYGYTMQAVPRDAVHPCNYIVYKKDIHEAKLEEIKARQNLEDALKTAQDASSAKGQFMSRMSHEIRTPLNAVLGYMSMARQAEGDAAKVAHCIENSEIAAKHLLNIINDVLDISAIESGKIKIANADFNLKELLTSLETVFSNQAQTKNIDFKLEMQSVSEDWVSGDSLRLNQVLMNLLSNAIKFTEENGHVTLSVKQIRHAEDKTLFQFEVSDDGIGMSEEFQSRLYERFEQASASTAVKYGGSGLGLSIAKNLVTMMNGSIDVKSKEGEGTTFTVVMALGVSAKKENEDGEGIQFAKKRILIVEDDEETLTFMKRVMKGFGLKAEFVETVDKAARKIEVRKASDYMYDLCLLESKLEGLEDVIAAKERLQEEPLGVTTETVTRPVSQSLLYNLLVKHFGMADKAAEKKEPKLNLTGIRVLLAEDNVMNMEIATDILTRAGIVVEGVKDGKEALDTFENSTEGYYQAILMDIQMPVMDGYEATRQIRKGSHKESKTIPIIAMTANAFTEDVSAAFSAGMNDHISKPVNFDKLYAALEKCTENK